MKLILSSNLRDWNISENFIAEKNLPTSLGVRLCGGRVASVEDGVEPAAVHLLPGEADGRR